MKEMFKTGSLICYTPTNGDRAIIHPERGDVQKVYFLRAGVPIMYLHGTKLDQSVWRITFLHQGNLFYTIWPTYDPNRFVLLEQYWPSAKKIKKCLKKKIAC